MFLQKFTNPAIIWPPQQRVLIKSLRNSKIHKGNFTSNSNSNKIKLLGVGAGGQHNLVLNKISMLEFHFLGLFTISKWIKQYFPFKRPKKIYFSCQINLTIRERPNKKNIETLNSTWKVNILRFWCGKISGHHIK